MRHNAFSPLKSLDCLSRIYPIKGAVVVGSGMGQGPWFELFQQQSVSDVALIDGSAQCVRHLENVYADQMDWQIHQLVFSDKPGEEPFYHLSSSLESGLLPAEQLQEIWPNIKTREEQICEVVTLGAFLQTLPFKVNWLIVDCLPAWRILGGENISLEGFDVIVVRSASVEPSVFDVDCGQVKALFQRNGFACVGSEPERNPALCHDVYVKDIAYLSASIDHLAGTLRRVESEKNLACEKAKTAGQQASVQIAELQENVEQLQEARDEQARLAQERQDLLDHAGSKEALKIELKELLAAELKATTPAPYGHNRLLTRELNKSLVEFGTNTLGLAHLKSAYIDYLGVKALEIEKSCIGRLATTVQDAVVRQLVAEAVEAEQLTILEIGSLYGVGLAILYNHAITHFREVRIAGLDPFDGFYGNALDPALNQVVNDRTFIRNMRLANVSEDDYRIIKFYSTQSEALEAAKELGINLLIIDGDHSFEGVKYDFDTYFPLLQPGGYVIFDDYNAEEWPGVQKFIDDDVKSATDFEYLGFFSRTAVGRKSFS